MNAIHKNNVGVGFFGLMFGPMARGDGSIALTGNLKHPNCRDVASLVNQVTALVEKSVPEKFSNQLPAAQRFLNRNHSPPLDDGDIQSTESAVTLFKILSARGFSGDQQNPNLDEKRVPQNI